MNNDEIDILTEEIFIDTDFNCRGNDITPGSVMDLAADIKSNSLLQRVIVQPWTTDINPKIKYRMVAGHRRFAACRVLKWKNIPCKILRNLSDEQAEIINLSENIKRKDLNILQEARSIEKMAQRGITNNQIAKRLDVANKWVDIRRKLLLLPDAVQQEAAAGIIKQTHIDQLYSLSKNPEKMYEAIRNIKNSEDRRRTIKVKKTEKLTDKLATRHFRNMSDIFKIQDLITDAIGTNLASRALAWAIGEIELKVLLQDVKAEADLLKYPWSIPQEYQ